MINGQIQQSSVAKREYKTAWQREQRRKFKEEHGYSTTANYGNGGLREQVLQRDGCQCVFCSMTAEEHLAKWNRPITVDHKDKNRKNNTLENLQTLCLRCHAEKDSVQLHKATAKAPGMKATIMRLRSEGQSYDQIRSEVGLSLGALSKWIRRWEQEG